MVTLSDIQRANILIVDDQQANVVLLTHILVASGYSGVSSTTDPRAVADLHRNHDFDVILLDLNMPGMDGFQVIEALREIEADTYLPVLVLTAQPDHKLRALQAGAKDFITKPFDNLEVLTRIRNMLEVRLLHKELRTHNEVLEQRVRERTATLHESYLETILTMTRAAEYKDEDTGAHIKRISYFCRNFAGWLGMDERFKDEIFHASPMHDIGKLAIPDRILLKPGALTPDEWTVMKTHVTVGASILSGTQSPYLKMGAEIALNHHERWDGGGYPRGLDGESIPLSARIMNLCDIYDALRSRRPYKPAFDHARAVEILVRGDSRTKPEHFDPELLNVFAERNESFREIFEMTE